eukprot:scaffold15697_cov40-Cyclotella_meneghiniana.AAC.3
MIPLAQQGTTGTTRHNNWRNTRDIFLARLSQGPHDCHKAHILLGAACNDHDLRSRRQSRRHRRPLDNNAFANAFNPPTFAAPAAATNAAAANAAAGAHKATTKAFANLCQLPTHLNPPQPQPPLQQPHPTLHQ